MTNPVRLLEFIILTHGERVGEFILPLLDESGDWSLAQQIVMQPRQDQAKWDEIGRRMDFDPSAYLGDFPPILWRVLARMPREDYDWACAEIMQVAREEMLMTACLVEFLEGQLSYSLRQNTRLELDRWLFVKWMQAAVKPCAFLSQMR